MDKFIYLFIYSGSVLSFCPIKVSIFLGVCMCGDFELDTETEFCPLDAEYVCTPRPIFDLCYRKPLGYLEMIQSL